MVHLKFKGRSDSRRNMVPIEPLSFATPPVYPLVKLRAPPPVVLASCAPAGPTGMEGWELPKLATKERRLASATCSVHLSQIQTWKERRARPPLAIYCRKI